MRTLKATVEITKIPWPNSISKAMQAEYITYTLESAGFNVSLVKCEEESNNENQDMARNQDKSN